MTHDPDGPTPEEAPTNPYAIPSTSSRELSHRGERRGRKKLQLSSLGKRFGAAIIDSTIVGGLYLLTLFFVIEPSLSGVATSMPTNIAILVFDAVYLVVSLYLAAARSQSIGKYMLGMQIVVETGDRAGFWRIVLLRVFVIQLVPCGTLIDPFFIFGQRRQCLHDLIASTFVVDLEPTDSF